MKDKAIGESNGDKMIENKYKILSTIIDKNLKSQNYAILKKFSTFLEQKRLVIFPFLQEA